ncbi:MAG TPA: bifunctional riboflavin kinase/FAD synthetase [Flavobacterium sp.]|nr:bifunctional riboflavin kinase/FAD synthetase [Flavobacterium sp.]
MRVFNHISDYESELPSVLTIGTFDGVHIGHKKIIEKVIKNARKEGMSSVILTFFPHPRMVLSQDSDIKLLNTIPEKISLLEDTGLDSLVIHPFDKAFSEFSAEEFVKQVLVKGFRLKKIVIGYDHRFGKNRTAGFDDLVGFGEQYGFEVEQISAQEIDEVSVSSTKVRNALESGEVALANSYLGYDYFFSGTVVKGNQLGRTIGFPTANLKVTEDYKLIPKNGVYIVAVHYNGAQLQAMLNIGTRPTVDGKDQSIEVNIFGFDKDIYGEQLTLTVLERIREEQKFASVEALQEQLHKDKKTAIDYFLNQAK